MSNALADYQVRTMLLWRESRWHCECGRVRARWIAHLYVDDVIAAERAFNLLSPMLRITQRWRAAVKSDPAALVLVDDGLFDNEQRQNEPERRAVPRGGRRGTDPGRPSYEFE